MARLTPPASYGRAAVGASGAGYLAMGYGLVPDGNSKMLPIVKGTHGSGFPVSALPGREL